MSRMQKTPFIVNGDGSDLVFRKKNAPTLKYSPVPEVIFLFDSKEIQSYLLFHIRGQTCWQCWAGLGKFLYQKSPTVKKGICVKMKGNSHISTSFAALRDSGSEAQETTSESAEGRAKERKSSTRLARGGRRKLRVFKEKASCVRGWLWFIWESLIMRTEKTKNSKISLKGIKY